ncbi:hypothetical protein, partial [Methanomethylophilus alvi]|uniref:hypothetical protein n=1 Tax=Methanomethylophilus alvi TaxID=1291540 RepID=UPI0037DD8ADC
IPMPDFRRRNTCSGLYSSRYVRTTVSAVAPKRMFPASSFARGRFVTSTCISSPSATTAASPQQQCSALRVSR